MTTREPRPQPVLDEGKKAAGVTLAVGTALTVLAALGITVPDAETFTKVVTAIATGSATLVGSAAALIAALRARTKVTPLESPMSADGVPLVTDLPGQHAADRP